MDGSALTTSKVLRGLSPQKRSDLGAVRRNPQLLQEAEVLRKERPQRSASHISDILLARHGVRVSDRTVRAHLHRRGLTRAELTKDMDTYEAIVKANDGAKLWTVTSGEGPQMVLRWSSAMAVPDLPII